MSIKFQLCIFVAHQTGLTVRGGGAEREKVRLLFAKLRNCDMQNLQN